MGGLGVAAEIRRLAPQADLTYLADAAGAPYGPRSLEEVRDRCQQVTAVLADTGCQTIVIACNTASAAALHLLREQRPDLDFVGMEPALKPAAESVPGGRIGVVATAATFQSRIFESVVERFGGNVVVSTAAAPAWVELVESGEYTGPRVERAVSDRLAELGDIDVIVLACTHFPALTPIIERMVGEAVEIIDPAPAVAAQALRVAKANDSLGGSGATRIWSTGSLAAATRVTDQLGLSAEFSVIGLE